MPNDGGVTFTNVSFTPPSRVRGDGKPILRDISLHLQAGTLTALLGRSGSGKTTLLRTVNGLVLPTSGSIEVFGVTVDANVNSETLRKLRHSIGYVIQETGLFPHMTVGRNVTLPLGISGPVPWLPAEMEQRAAELLHSVGLPAAEYAHRYPHELSGGQRQRVGLARALAASPKLLLLDEPFGALDPLTRAEMQAVLRDLQQKSGTTALMVTHDLDEALFLADRILFMDAGKVFADLRSSEVADSQLPGVQEYLRAARRFDRPVQP